MLRFYKIWVSVFNNLTGSNFLHAGDSWQWSIINVDIGYICGSSLHQVHFVELRSCKDEIKSSAVNNPWGSHWLVDDICWFCYVSMFCMFCKSRNLLVSPLNLWNIDRNTKIRKDYWSGQLLNTCRFQLKWHHCLRVQL